MQLTELKNKNMKKIIICISLTLSLIGCTSAPPTNVPEWVGKMKNTCLPEAIVLTQALMEKNIQAKVLSIHTKDWGHATCVYLYPPGQNRLWVWDSYWKSVPLRAWWKDPDSIAKAWMKWRHDETPITCAYFLEY
jgi:hypothetical protein